MTKDQQPRRTLIAFVVDDEKGPLEALANDLREQPEIKEVHTFSSYAEATYPLLELQPDVVFLDIEVPGKSGLDFLRSIRPRLTFTFHAVFYTGFSHYMLDAIRNSAFDFLLKPYKFAELRTIIDRLVAEPTSARTATQSMLPCDRPQKLAIQTISELLLVSVDEVLVVNYDSVQRAWILMLTDRTLHRLHTGLKASDIIDMSPTYLVRINSSCILNIQYLAAIENTTQHCRLCTPYTDIELTASRRYFSRLKERFELL